MVLDYALERTVAPTIEPLTAEAVKHQINIEGKETAFDAWMDSSDGYAIQAAREMVESHAQVALINQTWTLKLGEWPARLIDLLIHPVRSITSVTYFDGDGVSQTFSSANYTLQRRKFRSYIYKNDADTEWPILASDLYLPITVTFVAGYPDPTTDTTDILKRKKIPAAAKMAMLMLIAHWFRYRESVLIGSSSKEIEHGFNSFINTLRPSRYR